MEQARIKELKRISANIKLGALEAVFSASSGHPGGSLSISDILSYLYFEEMNIDPRDPKKADRDRFVLSKGHTAPALYAALAERGYFPREDLKTFRHIDSYLQGHPDMKGTPGVDMTTVKFVELDGRKLLDGGCTDSVPVEAFRKLGFRRNVVVLTRDLEYRKKPENTWMADLVYHKYPKFAEALKNRAVQYNRSIRNIEKLEKEGEVFVIRPSVPLTIPRICKSAEEIEKTYQIGVMDAKKMMVDLKKWLGEIEG